MWRAGPRVIFSSASAKSSARTALASLRAASSAASLTRLRSSAPTRPGVSAAMRSRETSGASGTFWVWTLRIAARPARSGRCTTTRRSKRPGPQQRRVEHVGPVGGGEHDDAFARVEAVHLGQDLVQRLLALVVAAERRAAATSAADGVQLVDEDDRGRGLPGLLEQVAHARRADADDHLDELGGAQAEEGDARLSGDRPRQQRLAGSGRTDQQHALRHRAAEPLVLGGVLQEVDDLDQLVLGLVDAGDVVEGDLRLLLAVALGAAAAEAEQPATAGRRCAATEPARRPAISSSVGPKPTRAA